MPDLTIEYATACATNQHWATQVAGSKGATYQVTWGYALRGMCQYDWSCTCPAFKHRKNNEYCKHILAVKNKPCFWNQELSTGPHPHGAPCPQCGGPVVVIAVGV